MKKLIALAIAILMMAALAVPAFAAEITPATPNQQGTTTVTYSPAEGYTVTIPDTLTVGSGSATLSVEANYATDKTIEVKVTSGNNFALENGDNDLEYVLKADGEAVQANDVVATTTTAKGTDSVTLTAEFAQGVTPPTAAGTYADTLTFTVTAE